MLIPVFLGLGIGWYFFKETEPNYIFNIAQLSCFSLLVIFSKIIEKQFEKPLFYKLVFALFLISSGFFIAQTSALNKFSPKIKNNLGVIWLRGRLVEIEKKQGFTRLLLSEADLWQPKKGKFLANETPAKIRLNVRTKIFDNLEEGDYIKTKVILSQPPNLPAYPNGYDFAKKAYFDKIGAVGFAISPIELFKKNQSNFQEKINNLRRNIALKIKNYFTDKNVYSTLAKLLVNSDGEIERKLEDQIRKTGLGHLLAISGLHMTVIMIWLFASIRFLLTLFPKISLNYDTKKFSAIVSLVIGLFYLILCKSPFSAVRAYLMVLVFFIAILINRSQTTKFPIAFAATIILTFSPESLIDVGFQLSFSAVIALIFMYEYFYKIFPIENRKNLNFILKFLLFFFELALSSFFVGIITAPIAIYHFGTYPKYSVFANMISIPAITFISMPFGFLGLIFMPLGLEEYFLKIASVGIIIMNKTAEYFSNLSAVSTLNFPTLPKWYLILFSLNFVCFFIFNSKIRYLFLPIVLFCYILIFNTKAPDILISEDRQSFLIKNSYFNELNKPKKINNKNCNSKECEKLNTYYLIGKVRRGFVLSEWKASLATDKIINAKNLKCEFYFCNESFLNKYENQGAIIIFKESNKITTAKNEAGERIWN